MMLQLHGFVEDRSPFHVSGWVAGPGVGTGTPIALVVNGEQIGTTTPTRIREDVRSAGFGAGPHEWIHRFDPILAWSALTTLEARVCVGGQTQVLPASHALQNQEKSRQLSDGIVEDREKDDRGLQVFVVGPPRSGSSALAFALMENFGLPDVGESHIMPLFQTLDHAVRDYFQGLAGHEVLMTLRVEEEQVRKSLRRIIRTLYRSVFPAGSWLDKTPTAPSSHGIALIRKTFPRAKIIALKRDGREVVDSFRKKFVDDFVGACECWTESMQGILQGEAADLDFLVIENAVMSERPGEAAAAICRYLGQDGKREQLEAALHIRVEATHHPHEQARVAGSSWTNEQRATFQQICGETMDLLGYAMRRHDAA